LCGALNLFKTPGWFGRVFLVWRFGFVFYEVYLFMAFSWNNGLREAVVSLLFVFEHFFYSSAVFIL
jgi:hypothetical protein